MSDEHTPYYRALVAPTVSPRTIGNRLLAADLRLHVRLTRDHLHHDTAKHGYSDVAKGPTGEWNGVLLFSVLHAILQSSTVHFFQQLFYSLFPKVFWLAAYSFLNIWDHCVVILTPHSLQVTFKSPKLKKKRHLGLYLDYNVGGKGDPTLASWWFP